MEGRIEELMIRFNLWRFFLNVLNPQQTNEEKLNALTNQRKTYNELYQKFLKSTADPIVKQVKRDPLSKDAGNGMWNNYFENSELKNEIKKDVDRTYLFY